MTQANSEKNPATLFDGNAPKTAQRESDPNAIQWRASMPGESVCVAASAGSGKTKVLIDRLLRLMLPRPEIISRNAYLKGEIGDGATLPHRILCLTYTKAAANEMILRLNDILASWAVADDMTLAKEIKSCSGLDQVDPAVMKAARRLFARVSDAPGGMKIMTIHSFCQSLLARFPLEAGVPPHFEVIDETKARLYLRAAIDDVFALARRSPDTDLARAAARIALNLDAERFESLLDELCRQRRQLAESAQNPQAVLKKLLSLHGLSIEDSRENLTQKFIERIDESKISAGLGTLLNHSGKKNENDAAFFQKWLKEPHATKENHLDGYLSVFLTQKGEILSKIVTNPVADENPDFAAFMEQEASRVKTYADALKALDLCALSYDLMVLGHEIIERYAKAKITSSYLDYDDLILKTRALLERPAIAPWILYKLDGGLDHILIDEAQDTSPDQWDIVRKLTDDFFDGLSARDDITRTVFIVGDKKQSIYSFQGAQPDQLDSEQQYYVQRAGARIEKMDISFRSVPAVLDYVDTVFGSPEMRDGLEDEVIQHISHRRNEPGYIEMWPLCVSDENSEPAPWTPPIDIVQSQSGSARLAEQMAAKIESWIGKTYLPSKKRIVKAGDIMILVRTRTAFVGQLVKALKTRNIPVSGADRMVLSEQIVVKDMMSMARFALFQGDDLALAEILKSPFVGLTDDDLMMLCAKRDGRLWDVVAAQKPDIAAYLMQIIQNAREMRPYEFFANILTKPCPKDSLNAMRAIQKRLGADVTDPLDEFLNLVLQYESENGPMLQAFAEWQKQSRTEIKREMDDGSNQVRIMTVHGAKGLQAPIVILPDTVINPQSKKIPNLLWPKMTGLDVPLWAPRSAMMTEIYENARKQIEKKIDQEYRRLLYVALTRAEDRLYIAGYVNKRNPSEESWYNMCRAAFTALNDGKVAGDDDILVYKSGIAHQPQADENQDGAHRHSMDIDVPPWLLKPPKAEPRPARPLIPSRADIPFDTDDMTGASADLIGAVALDPARSPLDDKGKSIFKRGNVTHKLLQILPSIDRSKRHAAAQRFLAQNYLELSEHMQKSIYDEVFEILNDVRFAPLFGEGSIAEVPLTGLVGARIVSGQIDRMIVAQDRVMIVDYKTNRPPPGNPADIPQLYQRQMKAYRDIVANIYPSHNIECFLLWTDGAVMMKVPL